MEFITSSAGRSLAAVLVGALLASPLASAQDDVSGPASGGAADHQPRQLDASQGAWRQNTWAGSGELRRVENGGDGDAGAFHIAARDGGDLGWTIEAPVEPNSVYRLSGRIRTEGVDAGTGLGALLNVHGIDSARTQAVTGTSPWTNVSTVFRTGDRQMIQINCLFGGWGQSRGQAWYDDVRLERFDLESIEPAVTVHADRTRPPMSPLIYGQFIEHMGRCIYGGIWAEMIEDRKFYFPITPEYNPYTQYTDTAFPVVGRSPWEIVGPAGAVEMISENSFVGDHTPRISGGAGIRQHDLAVVEGQRYVGHVWLKSAGGSPVVEVLLDAAERPAAVRGIGNEYTKHEFEFTAAESTEEATLQISVDGGSVMVGTLSLMPADNVRGLRADTLALLKQLDSPIYRWPGGNFVSGYDWRDGIGDRDRRPPRTNPAWTGIEPNDFGMHEFIDLCRELETEPLITINMGFEGAFSAEAEMEYANGREGHWAQKRAENGAPEPFGVKYWCIGNEMWGDWQLGHMSLEDYAIKHNWVVERLRKSHPDFVAIASGDAGPWSRGLLERTAQNTDMIAEHFYDQRQEDVAAHVQLVPESIRTKTAFHRSTQVSMDHLGDRRIPIAMTEWNYWYGPYKYGELGTVYYLRDALGIAAGLNEYSRSSDIVAAAFYAQTVNVIGAIKTTATDAFLATTALPLIMYRRHFGTIPVEVDLGDAGLLGLDVAAAWTEDRSALTLGIVNATREPVSIDLSVAGAELGGSASVWRISGDDPDLFNDAQNERVAIEELSGVRVQDAVTVPGYSASVYRIPVR